MYPNFSFFGHSALCYLTCGTALAYPALSGSSAEGFFGFEHESSQGDLFEVYNRGQLLNQKRPLELQPASSQSLMEAHGTNVGDHHSYEEAEYPMNTLMSLPNGQKRQKAGSGAYDGPSSMSGFASTYANSYQPFFPPDLQDGVQVYVDNVSLHPGGFPEETHENPNHERLVFEKEETNHLSLREDAQGNSIVNNPETDRLSRVDMELGSTDPKWHILRHQLESNSFSDKCVVGGEHIGSLNHAKTPDIFQFPVSSTGKGLFTPGSLQNVTPTTIAHEAENLCALHEVDIPCKFGNFRIPPLTFFPDTMRPRDPRILYKVNFNKDEEHILNYLFSFLKRCRTNHKYKNLELENIPVSLKKLVYKEERNSSEGDVLVTHVTLG
ncbi:hypothetical protein KEM48_011346 [Puccinia striiformis f. sp. tritici PST-130]|nr:hypothetical protein KEM48_011346 [Puccinia striiformis f. sp. tritici PST-130]